MQGRANNGPLSHESGPAYHYTEDTPKTLRTRFWASEGPLLAPTGPLSDVDRGLILPSEDILDGRVVEVTPGN